MGKKYIASILVFFLVINLSKAQQTKIYTHDDAVYLKALSLYSSEQYVASQALFQTIKNDIKDEQIKGECDYYISNCAIRLNQQNADGLMESFVENYPTSTKRNIAFNDVGGYYFKNSKYA